MSVPPPPLRILEDDAVMRAAAHSTPSAGPRRTTSTGSYRILGFLILQ